MKMKIFFAIFLLTMLVNLNNALSQNLSQTNEEVINVVKNTMKPFLDSIPDEILINYGIKDKSEINKATVGNPIAVYTLRNDSVVFTNTWRVPLIIDKEFKSLFTVIKNNDGEFKVVGFGATVLAKEIFSKSNEIELIGLLRVYELQKDFFICDGTNDGQEFQPIPDPEKRKYTLNDILNLVK